MRVFFKTVFVIPLIVLSGCMGGDMTGIMSDGNALVMNYSQGMASDTYTTKIDGEIFKGRAVSIDQQSTFGTAFGSAYSSYGSSFATATATGYTSGGKFKAVLLGDKGSSLVCLMQYADSSGFTSFGGVGECVHSDKRTVMITW